MEEVSRLKKCIPMSVINHGDRQSSFQPSDRFDYRLKWTAPRQKFISISFKLLQNYKIQLTGLTER